MIVIFLMGFLDFCIMFVCVFCKFFFFDFLRQTLLAPDPPPPDSPKFHFSPSLSPSHFRAFSPQERENKQEQKWEREREKKKREILAPNTSGLHSFGPATLPGPPSGRALRAPTFPGFGPPTFLILSFFSLFLFLCVFDCFYFLSFFLNLSLFFCVFGGKPKPQTSFLFGERGNCSSPNLKLVWGLWGGGRGNYTPSPPPPREKPNPSSPSSSLQTGVGGSMRLLCRSALEAGFTRFVCA